MEHDLGFFTTSIERTKLQDASGPVSKAVKLLCNVRGEAVVGLGWVWLVGCVKLHLVGFYNVLFG